MKTNWHFWYRWKEQATKTKEPEYENLVLQKLELMKEVEKGGNLAPGTN